MTGEPAADRGGCGCGPAGRTDAVEVYFNVFRSPEGPWTMSYLESSAATDHRIASDDAAKSLVALQLAVGGAGRFEISMYDEQDHAREPVPTLRSVEVAINGLGCPWRRASRLHRPSGYAARPSRSASPGTSPRGATRGRRRLTSQLARSPARCLPMLHAFRIGPFAEAPEPCFIYAARAPTGDVHATQAVDDAEGLRMLVNEIGGRPLLVEPLLARAGKRLGLRPAPLPPELAHEKATMALALALRMHELIGPRVGPSLVADLLDAAVAFHRAAPWRFVDSDVPLQVEVTHGQRRRTIDGALMGHGGQEFGFALYPQPGALRRLLAADDPERAAARTELLAVSLEREPAWVVEAVEQGLGAAVVPMPMRMKGRRPRALDPDEVAMLAALLRAASEIGPETREARGTSGVEPRVDVVVHVPVEASPSPPPEELRGARPKVGRNAPCPCGSGRKYKRCCLAKDEAAERARTPRPSPRAREGLEPDVRLVLEIIAFADERAPGWRSSPSAAWQGLMAQPAAEQLLMPLLAFQYHTADDLTAARLWWRAHADGIDAETREIFESEQHALLSVWEVLEVRPEVGLQLVNLLTHEQRFVHETKGTRGITVRDAVLARVRTRRGRSVLSGLHPRALPPATAHEVVTAVRRRLGLEVAAIPSERLGHPHTIDMLLAEWHAAHARVVDTGLVEREVHNTDGEPFEPHEDHFALARGSTRKEVAAALLELPGTHLDEDGRRKTSLTFTRPGNAMHPHWARTVIGTATIDERSLVLEANSRVRIDELRGQLERALGPRLEHRRRKRHPVKKARVPVAGEGPLALDATMAWGIWAPPPELMIREEARHFIDRPHDALGGLSPRVAVTKARPRRALHQLLKEHEHAHARSAAAGFASHVREALDLSPTGEHVPVDAKARRTGRGRKVSDTLIDFAVPILEEVTHESQLRPALELAALAWNLDVLELEEEVARIVALATEAGLEEAPQWLERLRQRRRLFAEDERIIEVLELRWADGAFAIKAAARLALRPRGRGRGQLGLFE